MEKIKHFFDGCAAAAACTGVLAVMEFLPTILGAIASIMSIVWYSIRFYEWYKGKKNVN